MSLLLIGKISIVSVGLNPLIDSFTAILQVIYIANERKYLTFFLK